MTEETKLHLLLRLQELQGRLEDAEQLIEAIKAGEVDAFAIRNGDAAEVYTLKSGDFAYRVMVEMLGEGAIQVTEEGLIVYANPYFCQLLGKTYDQILGKSAFEFITPETQTLFKAHLLNSLNGNSKGEIQLKGLLRNIPVYISLTSLRPELPTIGIILTDQSEKRKNEQMISKYRDDLELQNIKLKQRNEELASFAYVASHDLQEPLRKIQTFVTRIRETDYDKISEHGRDHFNRMHMAADRMQGLIEDLLLYSRTNVVEREFISTDLKELVTEVATELQDELNQKNGVIDTGELTNLNVIPFQFRQLLFNLFNNSIKFSHPDRPLRIKLESKCATGKEFGVDQLVPEKEYCHLRVSDNGIGFQSQYKDRIFELFQRLHGKEKYPGTGLGLAIVRKIVDNHHGLIIADGKDGEGATFDIYIPLEQN